MPGSSLCTSWRLAHFHDDGLDKVEGDDITTHTAHADAVAYVKGLATQNHEVPCETGDHFLERKCEARRDQTCAGCKSRGIIEPHRYEADYAENKGDKANPLAGPERDALGAPRQLFSR